jgi:hypothetical protein
VHITSSTPGAAATAGQDRGGRLEPMMFVSIHLPIIEYRQLI